MMLLLPRTAIFIIFHLSFLKRVATTSSSDFVHPNATITNLVFGSCHNARKVQPNQPNIWKAVQAENPDAFVWTGDAVYPRQRKIASLDLMKSLFDDMHTNDTIGYNALHTKHGIYGTWDDHDFGANDAGWEMPNKTERAALFYEFLRLKPPTTSANRDREGLYYSVTFGSGDEGTDDNINQQQQQHVKLIVLDTRWHRGRHCFPSVATYVPLGAGISAVLRWALGGFNVNRWWPFWDCWKTPILGEAQWEWLENELKTSRAAVNLVVSSIQVLTTNPTVEGWGHFPHERQRLLTLLGQGISGLFVLSGDVHHAEILDPLGAASRRSNNNNKQSFLEITSSGMTHYCSQPFYGRMCQPLLEHYNQNRFDNKDNYYIGRNYGTLQIDWGRQTAEVFVKNEAGTTVLRTGPRRFRQDILTEEEVDQVAPCVDGHLILPVVQVVLALAAVVLVGYSKLFFSR